VVNNLPS